MKVVYSNVYHVHYFELFEYVISITPATAGCRPTLSAALKQEVLARLVRTL